MIVKFKRQSNTILLSIAYTFFITHGCNAPTGLVDWSRYGYTEKQAQTLKTLIKIDDYPLYMMIYDGDYGFGSQLGLVGSMSSTIPHNNSEQSSMKWACTCFAALGNESSMRFGRNFDFYHRPSLLLFTDPSEAYASVSMVDLYYCGYEDEIPTRDPDALAGLLDAPLYPFDGMNEHGVTIGLMAVPNAHPPYDPSKTTLQDLQVIRLVLDYAGTTREAISLIQTHNVIFSGIDLHFLIADPTGDSAVIEFVNGEMVVLRDTNLFQVSTNFVLHQAYPNLAGNCCRYDTAFRVLEVNEGIITQQEAVNILDSVSQNTTMWSTVFDMKTGDISVAMGEKYDSVHKFRLTLKEKSN